MISMDKKYRTRDGKEVRIYSVGNPGIWAIHGAYKFSGDIWQITCWNKDGKFSIGSEPHDSSNMDLVEVKPRIKQTVWMNVYANECSSPRKSKEDADALASPRRLACVKIEIDCEEGEGL